MPRKYISKTSKAKWTDDTLKKAILEIQAESSLRNVKKIYNIPRSTLSNYMQRNCTTKMHFGGRTVLTLQQENDLTKHILQMRSSWFWFITEGPVSTCI